MAGTKEALSCNALNAERETHAAGPPDISGSTHAGTPGFPGLASASPSRKPPFFAEPDDVANKKDSKYVGIRFLGSGSSGQVWLAQRASDDAICVIKVTRIASLTSRGRSYALSERRCLALCDNPFIVRYIEDYEDEECLHIVMEYADGGDLERQLRARAAASPQLFFTESDVWKVFLQILLAVDFVHSHKMLHRDIKSANFMLNLVGICLLGDFGFSHQYEETVSNPVAQSFCGTPYYLAPEIWRRERYSKKADCWSVGVALFEVMALAKPFQGKNVKSVMNSVLKNVRGELPPHYSEDARDLVISLLNPDPNLRASIADVLSHSRVQEELINFANSVSQSDRFDDKLRGRILGVVASAQERYSAAGVLQQSLSNSIFGRSSIGLPNPFIVFEGEVSKLVSSGCWKPAYLILREGTLRMEKAPTPKNESATSKESGSKSLRVDQIESVIPVPPTSSQLPNSEENVFAIAAAGNWMFILAPSKLEMENWIEALHQALGISC